MATPARSRDWCAQAGTASPPHVRPPAGLAASPRRRCPPPPPAWGGPAVRSASPAVAGPCLVCLWPRGLLCERGARCLVRRVKRLRRKGGNVVFREDFCRSMRVCLRRPGPSKKKGFCLQVPFLSWRLWVRGNEKMCSLETAQHSPLESQGTLVCFWVNTKTNPSSEFCKLLRILSRRGIACIF